MSKCQAKIGLIFKRLPKSDGSGGGGGAAKINTNYQKQHAANSHAMIMALTLF